MDLLNRVFTTYLIIYHIQANPITTPVITNKGHWKEFQTCPVNTFIVAFDLATYTFSNPSVTDHLGLVNVVFQCSNPSTPTVEYISTDIGGVRIEFNTNHDLTTTGEIVIRYDLPLRLACNGGVAVGFQFNSQKDQGSADDTGGNNLRIFCSEQKNNEPSFLEGYGDYDGDWSTSQHCGPREALCGVQTQGVDFTEDGPDNIGIENLRFKCCSLPNPGKICAPTAEWQLVDATENMEYTTNCNYTAIVGLQIGTHSLIENEQYNFNEAVGYNLNGNLLVQSALYENIIDNLGSSFGYNWERSTVKNWFAMNYVSGQFPCGGIATRRAFYEIYQLVARCSYFSLRSHRFRRVEYKEDGSGGIGVKEFEYGG